LGILACTLAAPLIGTTPGAKYMDTVVQDDAVFLHSSPAQVDDAAQQLEALGADYLRVTAGWSVIAPAPTATQRPWAPFDPADPATYGNGFAALDRAVIAAAGAGLKIETQWRNTAGGAARPVAADRYRAMYLAAYDAIKAVAPADKVLLGNLASTTSDAVGHGGIPPLRFLREMACVDDQLKPLTTPECANYRPLPADGIALHPYSNHFGSPAATSPALDDVPLADTSRLTALLGALKAEGRITSWWPLYDTEYGYETSPPDPFQSTTPTQQAQYIGESSFLAWKDPNTRMFAQFELRDVDPTTGRRAKAAGTRAHWADYQSGLYYADGRAKPAAAAFATPFWAEHVIVGDDEAVALWGMVRPGHGRRVVRFERQDPTTGAWVPLNTYGLACLPRRPELLTDPSGVSVGFAPWVGPGAYRMSWLRTEDNTWAPAVPVDVGAAMPAAAGGGMQGRWP
jgi:hypothetical protein